MPTINKEISDWISVNTETGLAIGTLIKLQNQGSKFLVLQTSSTQPDSDDFSGEMISTMFNSEASKVITEGSEEVWVRRLEEGTGTIRLFAQLWVE